MKLRITRTVERLRRYRHIMGVLIRYGFDDFADRFRRTLVPRWGSRVIPSRIRPPRGGQPRQREERVRLALEELGPLFVKLGQLLSTRPDLIPNSYAEELSKLQDRVTPEKFAPIRTEVTRQLGKPLDQLFRRFDPEPLAAASIAQVHRAETLEGKKVVVKVRRPGITDAVRVELEILEDLARLLKASSPKDEPFDPVLMVREFSRAVTAEVDFRSEARNMTRFRRNFHDDPSVHVPEVLDELSSEGVLTMEYIDGVKASDLPGLSEAGLDRKLIAQRGAHFILMQIFEFGYFHADPHPGNMLVMEDNVLAPLDFGQVARLGEAEKLLLGDLVLAIVDFDAEMLVRTMDAAGLMSDTTDQMEMTRQIEDRLDRFRDVPLKEIAISEAITQTFDLIRTQRIHPPAQFTLMLKSLLTIESMAKTLDPDFDMMEALKPYSRRLSASRIDPRRLFRHTRRNLREAADLLGEMPAGLRQILARLRRGNFRLQVEHEHLSDLIHTVDRSSNRIAFALIIAALIIGSGTLLAHPELRLFGFLPLPLLGTFGYLSAAVLGLWLVWSIIRSMRY